MSGGRGLMRRLGEAFKALTIQTVAEGEPFYEERALPQALPIAGTQRGLDANVIMAPVLWIMRTFTEAQAVVQRKLPDAVWGPVDDHPVERLIDRPNDFYDGDALWKATALSFVLEGNAYWRKVRNPFGEVVGLWYVPHWLMRPEFPSDGSAFISHYRYTPGTGQPIPIPRRDVVHFRFGLDPENTRLGLSPLRCLLREVLTDQEASRFSETILQNMGVPGLMIAPKSDANAPTPDQVKEMKEFVESNFRSGNRGRALVLGKPTEISQFGFDPNKLMLANLRDISEERVCAVLGIPSAVVGFGSGLQSTKVGATMRELRRLAWVQCLIPMQKSLAKQLTGQLLADFTAQSRRYRVRFDTSDVSAFQEEDDLRATRVAKLVVAGILRVDRAQEMLGLEVDQTQQVYLRPTTAQPFGPGAPAPAESGAPPADGEPSGDGAPDPEDDEQKLLAAIATRLVLPSTTNGHTPA